MDWSIEVNEESATIMVTLKGRWETAGIMEALRGLWTEQGRTGILKTLWDFREIVASGVPTAELRDVAAGHLAGRPELPEARVAVVVSRDLEFGMARMIEAFMAESPVDMQTFRDLGTAWMWLAEMD